MYYLSPGDACALSMICCIKNEPSALKGIAMSKGNALLIPVHQMDGLMREHRQWFYFVLETFRSKFDEVTDVVDQIAFNSMDKKLESYLQRLFDLTGDKVIITHQQIAVDLNTSREVISRLMKKLASQKKISIERHVITRLNF
jgi:CRP/FNR family transcriptional regulator, anaerobic regulatory protein